ncbi:MAG: CHAT domain-containing protein [Cyanobacteria bacterium P01_H01_bin.121]
MRKKQKLTCLLLAIFSCLLGLLLQPTQAVSSDASPSSNAQIVAQATLEQGQQLYNQGQLEEAIQVLQQVTNTAPSPTEEVTAWRNLALVYQQLGKWDDAERAIAAAQSLLNTTSLPNQNLLLAQVLDVQGGLQLEQGQGEAAIVTWQQSWEIYTQLDYATQAVQAQVNQAQAMQRLGFHRQAIATLVPVVEALSTQPDSLTEAVAQRTLGDSLLQAGNLTEAQAILESSQAIAQALSNSDAVSATALSLGNLKAAQGETEAALAFYAEANTATAPKLVQVQAQLNQLDLFTKTAQLSQAQGLWPTILNTLNTLALSQTTLFAKINLAQTLIELPVTTNPTPRQIADLLAMTIQQAQTLGDRRSESFATGTLGHHYETQAQWSEAADLSQSALALAQEINASDITYRWQWQLGRLYRAEKQTEKAIAAYSDAVTTLQRLRTDLVAINPAVQVSFQNNVEPIHRELVALLLDPNRSITSTDLEKARTTIEALQLAELDNFFREACLDAAAIDIDQLDQRAAVVYPVILSDRLEVIVSLPNRPLQHYTSPISATDLDEAIEQFQRLLVLRIGRQYLPFAEQLYDWLMQPAAADLAASEIDTLVFVLDGELRNIPMAALYDGSQFLLEKYNLALTPGLQLVNPQPLQGQALRVVTAGLSEARQGFSALPNVVKEVQQIQETVPTAAVLLNDEFTSQALESSLNFEGAPIVHLASHGKFSSSSEETFVLTWDDRLNAITLNSLLQTSELNQNGPIQLLVLSACQTATGDKQAALGLAGMAVRSGARSTIATLWQVNDAATAALMTELYSNLTDQQMTKAEALRQAQLSVLNNPQFRQHPFFWAPYVLVGNWL